MSGLSGVIADRCRYGTTIKYDLHLLRRNTFVYVLRLVQNITKKNVNNYILLLELCLENKNSCTYANVCYASSYGYVHFEHAFRHDLCVPGLHVPVEVSLAYQYFAATIAPVRQKRNEHKI